MVVLAFEFGLLASCNSLASGIRNAFLSMGDGLEDKPEYGGTLEAALRHGFYDFAYGLGSCGHDHLAVYFHRPCNGGAKVVVVRAQFRADCSSQAHGDYGTG